MNDGRQAGGNLAADVVGYIRLMAVDKASRHARLKALRKDFVEPAVAWGFREVSHFRKGFLAWNAAGFPVAAP